MDSAENIVLVSDNIEEDVDFFMDDTENLEQVGDCIVSNVDYFVHIAENTHKLLTIYSLPLKTYYNFSAR